MCGEHKFANDPLNQMCRSIPACAGNTLAMPLDGLTPTRSIPACAGNTHSPLHVETPGAGPSPRVRGTRHHSVTSHHGLTGPSPRVRGTRPSAADAHAAGRSIPACAGNTPLTVTAYETPILDKIKRRL